MNNLIEFKDLTNYIKTLPKAVFEKIFDHPTTCLAIFRELPDLAKVIIMRLLLLNQEVPQETVKSWINSKYSKESQAAFQTLTGLNIWQEIRTAQGGMPAWTLKSSFKENLFLGIFRNPSLENNINENLEFNTANSAESNQSADPKIIEKLDKYAVERWESILNYIINPKDKANQISNSTKEVLKFSGLMKSLNPNQTQSFQNFNDDQPSSDDVTLTASAFQFLLWNRKVQIWYFIIQLLEYFLQRQNQDLSECLTLLFELSFSTFGKKYPCDNFSEKKNEFLQELRKIGLVHMATRKIKRFHPTRLAIQLANGVDDNTEVNKDEKGFIIVETNYRIYAYTDSNLEINLLALFSELLYKFPKMVVAVLTRESVREAFKMGITANQIINFLRANAHPQIRSRKPVLPETVSDQISLWFQERNRFKFTEGVYYGQFNSDDDFSFLKNYAKDLDALLWFNDSKRLMVVKKDSHDSIKKYWKQNKRSTD